jgi:hypothetical protein
MGNVTWILESDVFPETHLPVRDAIRRIGHSVVNWDDAWWNDGFPVDLTSPIVFHGSLGNAALITERLNWRPGSFCPVDAFRCSTWYESARPWLLHSNWHILPANAAGVAKLVGSSSKLFVRPDSPLKPFSGRIVDVESLTLSQLDHGFYYDDETIPVVVAPVCQIGSEWRFIVVRGTVIAGSSYDPSTRKPQSAGLCSTSSQFAAQVASAIPAPADVYVLDVCECAGEYRLLELNPFGGADLYLADPDAIIEAVSSLALE